MIKFRHAKVDVIGHSSESTIAIGNHVNCLGRQLSHFRKRSAVLECIGAHVSPLLAQELLERRKTFLDFAPSLTNAVEQKRVAVLTDNTKVIISDNHATSTPPDLVERRLPAIARVCCVLIELLRQVCDELLMNLKVVSKANGKFLKVENDDFVSGVNEVLDLLQDIAEGLKTRDTVICEKLFSIRTIVANSEV